MRAEHSPQRSKTTRRCYRCGNGVVIRPTSETDKRLAIDPTTKRSPLYCRICWPKLPPALRASFKQDGFVTSNV